MQPFLIKLEVEACRQADYCASAFITKVIVNALLLHELHYLEAGIKIQPRELWGE